MIPGVLHLSSRTIYNLTKNNVPQLRFTALDTSLPSFIVATKRQYQPDDVYAIITPTKDTYHTYTIGNLDRIVGNVGDPQTELEFLKDRHHLRFKKFRQPIDITTDLTPDRQDLTDRHTVSIDPENCLDVDDALSCTPLGTEFEVGIHIADVSSFIVQDSPLDLDLRTKVESIYMHHQQTNMLPDILASDICSLVQNKKRRTYTVLLTVNNYKITQTKFTKAFIINKKQYTYDNAQKSINNDPTLSALYTIGQNWYSQKFPATEYNIHKMVEIFMLTANIAVATHLAQNAPKSVILRSQKGFKEDSHKNTNIPQTILHRANMYKLEGASYVQGTTTNTKHELLQEEHYTHFTSPIRRYIDIIIHRLLYNTHTKVPDICEYVNTQHKKIKLLERESHILDIVHKNQDLVIEETPAYIIKISDTLLVHIPLLNVDAEVRLFSNKLKHLIENITITPEQIQLQTQYAAIKLSIFEQIKVKITVSNKATKIRKKLLVQIIDPDIICLFQKN
jgi:exoribonuclease R